MRECPFNGCTTMIPPDKFACGKHWFSLNHGQQRRVYQCYGDWAKGAISGDDLRRIQQAVLDETSVGGHAE